MPDPAALTAPPRFYAILDSAWVPPERWLATARAVIAGGAALVQVRAKRESPAARRRLAEAVLPLLQEAGVPLVINDDVALAAALPGAGLHVGQDDTPPAAARAAIGPDRLLGLSTHSPQQARAAIALAGTIDYFAVGPVFSTRTKPDYQPVGLELVRTVAAWQPPLPFYCIGGITADNVAQVRAAGGRNIVAVTAVLLADDPAAVIRKLMITSRRGLAREEAIARKTCEGI
jgi:thiamine-phosphate pyrophosphorylase